MTLNPLAEATAAALVQQALTWHLRNMGQARRALFDVLLARTVRVPSAADLLQMARTVYGMPDEAIGVATEYPPGAYRLNGGLFFLTGYNSTHPNDVLLVGMTDKGCSYDDIVPAELATIAPTLH